MTEWMKFNILLYYRFEGHRMLVEWLCSSIRSFLLPSSDRCRNGAVCYREWSLE